ncbi:SURF1 family protein [Vulcaniibacterium tengchongense]|uniref:SURF1-like protein n=1 Tax=Vulcaniibacterium tengchongense TaxID=1273429 RepID=A0A3N4VQR8_9GAMM|nr:SURF1 family protein [Vulcaniibacterium tengchongense]RPE81551.1 surfeit locus 1 family protein [Vulcaniibacterium tengchongense]
MSHPAREREGPAPRPRGRGALFALLGFLALACAGFAGLGIWQVQRLAWKRDLIERVEARVHAPPAPAPGPREWPRIGAAAHEYLRVRLDGRYLDGRDTRVQAVTELGPGFWLLTPLRTREGSVVLVNRGFVPPDWRGAKAPRGETQVVGLLRLSEPGGGFLRRNDPARGRWYSRDVRAIAAARGLDPQRVAPYFVDAERAPGAAAAAPPVGGLTVVRFRNNHLSYAVTWFVLAAMAAAAAYVLRDERRRRARTR